MKNVYKYGRLPLISVHTREYTEDYVNILTTQLRDRSLDEQIEGLFRLEDVPTTINDVFRTFQHKKYLTPNATKTFYIIKDKILPISNNPLYFTCMWTTAANDGVKNVPELFSSKDAALFLLYKLAKKEKFLPDIEDDLMNSVIMLDEYLLENLPSNEAFSQLYRQKFEERGYDELRYKTQSLLQEKSENINQNLNDSNIF